MPMTVKPAACRKLMWMTPDDGVASPGTGDGPREGAVICGVSIGKGLTSSVVRPPVETVNLVGGRRMFWSCRGEHMPANPHEIQLSCPMSPA